MTKPKEVTVKQSEEAPIPTEVLASSIVAISEGIKKIRSGRLNDRALILLIQDAAPSYHKISKETIKDILNAIESLERTFTNPKKKPTR